MTIRTTFLQRGFRSLMLAALTLMSVNVWAHTELTASEPGADVVLQASPEQLKLTFSSQVQLMSVSLVRGDSEKVELDFTRSSESMQSHSISLPSLEVGLYTVSWGVLGSDGHQAQGKYSFSVGSEQGDHQDHSH
ncbi:MAG: copper resistance protein CopC [Pseudohongiellaceae bacterium]